MSLPIHQSLTSGRAHTTTVWARAVLSAVVLLIVALVFKPLAGFPLLYDDAMLVRDNPALRAPLAWAAAWTQPYWIGPAGALGGLYRPLHMALLSVVARASVSPAGFHLYALGLHLAATALIGAILWRVTRRPLLSGMLALVFGLMPVHVEAVASVVNTSEVLVAIFLGVGILTLLHRERDIEFGVWRCITLAFLALCAMFAKESGAALVPIFVLLALLLRPGLSRRSAATLSAFLGVATVIAFAARFAVLGRLSGPPEMAVRELRGLPFLARAILVAPTWLRAAWLVVWPHAPVAAFGPEVLDASLLLRVGALLAACSICIVLFYVVASSGRRGEPFGVAAAFALSAVLAFVPACNLLAPTGQLLAERTLYSASFLVVAALGVALSALLDVGQPPALLSPSHSRAVGLLALGGWLTLATPLTLTAVSSWSSHVRLFSSIVDAHPDGYRGHHLLGLLFRDQHRLPASIAHLERAMALSPSDTQVRLDLAGVLLAGQMPERSVRLSWPLCADGPLFGITPVMQLCLNGVGQAHGARAVLAAVDQMNARHGRTQLGQLYRAAADAQLGDLAGAQADARLGLELAGRDSSVARQLVTLSLLPVSAPRP